MDNNQNPKEFHLYSDRKSARKKLEVLTDGDEKTKMRLMTALKNVNLEYLP